MSNHRKCSSCGEDLVSLGHYCEDCLAGQRAQVATAAIGRVIDELARSAELAREAELRIAAGETCRPDQMQAWLCSPGRQEAVHELLIAEALEAERIDAEREARLKVRALERKHEPELRLPDVLLMPHERSKAASS